MCMLHAYTCASVCTHAQTWGCQSRSSSVFLYHCLPYYFLEIRPVTKQKLAVLARLPGRQALESYLFLPHSDVDIDPHMWQLTWAGYSIVLMLAQ